MIAVESEKINFVVVSLHKLDVLKTGTADGHNVIKRIRSSVCVERADSSSLPVIHLVDDSLETVASIFISGQALKVRFSPITQMAT